ncbi:flagellar protein FlaG [Brevundimonas sp.]|uniref:flagellar protein FlaG n=1 Tax=Brevundimonas sp. TaxID=1871086 RepID=UPI003D6D8FF6
MADNVARVPGVAFINPEALGQGVEAPQRPVQQDNDAGRYRLTIEEGPNGFVYKTVDRVTGEVIRQLPREDVVKMRHSPAYGAGELIKTKV